MEWLYCCLRVFAYTVNVWWKPSFLMLCYIGWFVISSFGCDYFTYLFLDDYVVGISLISSDWFVSDCIYRWISKDEWNMLSFWFEIFSVVVFSIFSNLIFPKLLNLSIFLFSVGPLPQRTKTTLANELPMFPHLKLVVSTRALSSCVLAVLDLINVTVTVIGCGGIGRCTPFCFTNTTVGYINGIFSTVSIDGIWTSATVSKRFTSSFVILCFIMF